MQHPGSRLGASALVTVALLVAVSCGTRVDRQAFEASLRSSGAAAGVAGGESDGGTAEGSAGAAQRVEAQPAGGGSGVLVAPGTGSAGGETGGNETGGGVGAAGGGDGASAPSPPDRPEVSGEIVGDVIDIGMHVPINGAAPIPTDFKDTLDVIEEYINTEAPIHGRTIKLHIEDDGYDAQVGLAACKKLVDKQPLFVIGHTMPAAQDACADEFHDARVPYLMRGTYPQVLDGRPLAWFGTTPDDVQGWLLADYVLHQLGGVGGKSAVVYQNDQVAAKQEFIKRIEAGGGEVVGVEQSVPRQSDYSATVEKLQSAGAEFVMLSMPPVDAIKIATQAQSVDYHPIWLGGGTWWNYNMVLESAGTALDGAVTLSPWSSIDSAAADSFKDVYRRYRPNSEPQDIGLIVWGWMQLTRAAMEAAGPDLSRESFVAALDQFRFSEPYWVPISYTPENRRGTDRVTVFRADGQAQRWRQVTGFTSEL